jgi:hypothetical protein
LSLPIRFHVYAIFLVCVNFSDPWKMRISTQLEGIDLLRTEESLAPSFAWKPDPNFQEGKC